MRRDVSIVARLTPAQSLADAIADQRREQRGIRDATIGSWSQDVVDRYLASPFTLLPAATGYSNLRSRYERPLFVLAAIVAIVLLIGCVNVANLLLARAIARRHELSVRLALFLAGLGLYDVSAYAISLRRTDMAIRIALGASPAGTIVRALARLSVLIAIGIALGTAVGLWASRFLEGLIFGVTPRQPAILISAGAVLLILGALAAWLPARQAARMNPVTVLRQA